MMVMMPVPAPYYGMWPHHHPYAMPMAAPPPPMRGVDHHHYFMDGTAQPVRSVFDERKPMNFVRTGTGF